MTKEQARTLASRANGTFFYTLFGGLWLCVGCIALRWFAMLIGLAAGFALLWLFAGRVLARAKLVTTETSLADPRVATVFKRVNIAQYVGIGGVLVLFNILQLQEYISVGIATVVALHFLPLAKVLGNPIQYAMAAALLVGSAVVVVLVERASVPAVSSITTGALLWASSLLTLLLATRAARQTAVRPAEAV